MNCSRCGNEECTCSAEAKLGLSVIAFLVVYLAISYFKQH
jgi:hypothetical protein